MTPHGTTRNHGHVAKDTRNVHRGTQAKPIVLSDGGDSSTDDEDDDDGAGGFLWTRCPSRIAYRTLIMPLNRAQKHSSRSPMRLLSLRNRIVPLCRIGKTRVTLLRSSVADGKSSMVLFLQGLVIARRTLSCDGIVVVVAVLDELHRSGDTFWDHDGNLQ